MSRPVALACCIAVTGCLAQQPANEVAPELVAPNLVRPSPQALDKRRHPSVKPLGPSLPRLRRAAGVHPDVLPPPTLTYGNGPLIDDVKIYAVTWGSKVDAATTAGLPGFFAAISSDAPYMQMLSEYDVAPYVIGHGTFGGLVVDADAPQGKLDSTTGAYFVQDQDVQSELSRLVDDGMLPAPDGHNIFMVYFDADTLLDGACTSYCAYHNSFTRNGQPTYYAIMPDLGHNGCEQGCGFNTVLNNLYSTSSHELVEAITDADVGNNNLAWSDPNSGNEIGDICTDWDGTASTYNVQSQWSNESTGCRDHRPAPVTTGSVTAADATVAPGGTATFHVTTSGTAPGPWTLELKEYVIQTGNLKSPQEYPFTFTPPTVMPGQSSVLTVKVPANDPNFGFGKLGYRLQPRIAATDASGVHRFVTVDLDVVTGAATISKIAPATGPTIGGTMVKVTGTNFASDAKGYFCPATGACDPATNAVPVVNGAPSSDGKSFTFTTPDHAAGAARFMLSNPADSARPAFASFTFTVAKKSAPTITSVTPSSGPTVGGTDIAIVGTHFDQASAGGTPNVTLTIGGTVVPNVFVPDAQHIFATTPAHAAGSVAVQVTNADKQTVTKAKAFTYGSGNAPASGLSLATTMGPTSGGTYVVINGDNFLAGVTVTFGGAAATVKSLNTFFIGVVTPAHAAGAVPVVVTNPLAPASPPLTFTFVAGPPPDLAQAPADMTTTTATDLATADDGGAPADDLATGGGGHGGSGGAGGNGGSGGSGGHLGGGGCSVGGTRDPGAPSLALLMLALLVIVRSGSRRAR